jgi:hypothetical protein
LIINVSHQFPWISPRKKRAPGKSLHSVVQPAGTASKAVQGRKRRDTLWYKHTKNDAKSPFFMGKSTISMAIFNSKLLNYQRIPEGAEGDS